MTASLRGTQWVTRAQQAPVVQRSVCLTCVEEAQVPSDFQGNKPLKVLGEGGGRRLVGMRSYTPKATTAATKQQTTQ